MRTTLDDLRVALHEQAHLTPYPDVEALVAGARRRVGLSRRRRLAALSASTAAVLLLGGFVVSTGSTHRTALQPAKPELGSFSVNAAGAGFPELIQGMRRVTELDAPMLARMKGSISIPTAPGEQLSVKMTCTLPKGFAVKDPKEDWLSRTVVNFTGPGGKAIGRCFDQGVKGELVGLATGDVIGVATGETAMVSADVSVAAAMRAGIASPEYRPSVAAPKGAKIHVAIYQTVPWQKYPFPPRPVGVNTPVWHKVRLLPDGIQDGTVVSGALVRQIQGPTSAANANNPLSVGWPYDPVSRLVLEVRGPGRLRVLIDGINISAGIADCPLLGCATRNGNAINLGATGARSTPLRDGYLTYWSYEQVGATFPLDPQMATQIGAGVPASKPGTSVTLTIIPEDFTGPDWRVIYEPVGKA